MGLIVGIVFLAIIVIIIVSLVGIYNSLVAKRNQYKNAFSQIDVQLKRRYDLIPNLVESAKAYIKHERETLEAVIRARNSALSAAGAAMQKPGNPEAMLQLGAAEQMLTGALGKLFALSESYPDLKANQTITSLMEELTSTENRVSFARQAYNDSVMSYNTSRETFPNVLIAGPFGFQEAALFEIPRESAAEREPIRVKF